MKTWSTSSLTITKLTQLAGLMFGVGQGPTVRSGSVGASAFAMPLQRQRLRETAGDGVGDALGVGQSRLAWPGLFRAGSGPC